MRPAAQSIPLGASGTSIEVRMNEDGSYSYLDGGQWLVITADSRMSAANGNVYGPLLAPDGRTPVGVMHVAAMQDVALGALGGTLQLTQAEDMTWWLGDMQVMSGHVHTANGNRYVLTLDAAGMWSAVYQQNMVTVALGTQGSVSLAQAEDMSWWLGTEGVESGSEVMSDSGNTYTLQYADGAWTARFEPESTAIAGTALVAMSKEDRAGYDVDGAELPASGMGDIATSMGSYRVTMKDGMLTGVRLDPVAIDGDTDFWTIGLGPANMRPLPVSILGDEDDTEDVNEGMTALVVDSENHPFSALLGSGVSETKGTNFVSRAHKELVEIRAKIEAVLDVFETEADRDMQVRLLWGTVESDETARKQNVLATMEKAFGRISGFRTNSGLDSAATPDDNDALSEIDDLIAALASVDGLAAALADDGTLDDLKIDEKDLSAQQIFDATETETSVSYDGTGMTRYGAIYKTARDTALDKAEYKYDNDNNLSNGRIGTGVLGAFAFGVTAKTDRSRYVASSGNAFYEGETLAVDQGGTHYEGDISLRVRFSTSKVDGLVSNLRSSDGDPWVYLFDEVSSIVLPTANLATGATFSGANNASISYALRAGSTGSQPLTSTWGGILLGGNGAKAGNQVVGHWSVGANPDASSYLAGGFGAERVADEPDRRPTVDDGTVVKTKVLGTPVDQPYARNADDNVGTGGTGMTALADDKLTITVGKFGWERAIAGNRDDGHRWGRLDKDNPETDAIESNNDTMKYEISLSDLLAKAGSSDDFSDKQANFVAEARKMIETEREKLAVLLDTEQLPNAQKGIWQRVQEILLTRVFDPDKGTYIDNDTTPLNEAITNGDSLADSNEGAFLSRLPDDIKGAYKKDTALETIDEILVALSSASDLEAAFDKDETALFVPDDEEDVTFLHGRTAGQIWGQTGLEVRARAGKTDFTRFGVWRVRRARTASYHDWVNGEMDTFAYSPLDVSKITATNSPNYPVGGSAVYEGSTVAWVGTDGYEGDAAMHVTWNQLRNQGNTNNLPVGGSITAVFSNLAAASTGDTLMHNSQPVRELVFDSLNFTAADDGELRFNMTTMGVGVRYTDPNAENGDAYSANLNGAFVGSSSDGPLGVLGRYMIPGGGGSGFQGGTINGAFGADLP